MLNEFLREIDWLCDDHPALATVRDNSSAKRKLLFIKLCVRLQYLVLVRLLINMAATMQAVVFKGPKEVQLERRPIPQLQDPKDVIVKVEYTALCGR